MPGMVLESVDMVVLIGTDAPDVSKVEATRRKRQRINDTPQTDRSDHQSCQQKTRKLDVRNTKT